MSVGPFADEFDLTKMGNMYALAEAAAAGPRDEMWIKHLPNGEVSPLGCASDD